MPQSSRDRLYGGKCIVHHESSFRVRSRNDKLNLQQVDLSVRYIYRIRHNRALQVAVPQSPQDFLNVDMCNSPQEGRTCDIARSDRQRQLSILDEMAVLEWLRQWFGVVPWVLWAALSSWKTAPDLARVSWSQTRNSAVHVVPLSPSSTYQV